MQVTDFDVAKAILTTLDELFTRGEEGEEEAVGDLLSIWTVAAAENRGWPTRALAKKVAGTRRLMSDDGLQVLAAHVTVSC